MRFYDLPQKSVKVSALQKFPESRLYSRDPPASSLKGCGKTFFQEIFPASYAFAVESSASSDVKVFCKFCVFLYKDAARLDLVAHKEREGLVTR